ncbi:glycosyltransferase family 2 protein [Actibacterium lipolyticum]|uniref:Glycosyl transferase family 2 n=1 Tax=Actibacterium lipolyticum TaxID=1524263 RepID=A0A238KUE9_9RHOB|nr:glycosyltransferase family 2 protein [Actibacterium lipolyticum]SMX46484.1 Glycosyl transferase family 2 [Actibacterium lipolyticum]
MTNPTVGVIIVSFNSGDVVLDCLESLLAAQDPDLRIVVVDNNSPDDTVQVMRNWADGTTQYTAPTDSPFPLSPAPKPINLVEGRPDLAPDRAADVVLLHAGENGGYAGGVNVGQAYLAAFPEIDHFWILNPDSMVPPASVAALKAQLASGATYGMLSGRVNYFHQPDMIQVDGGSINFRTGVTDCINLGQPHPKTPLPAPGELHFVTGANMVASRAFCEKAGPMAEDYFLYYEEVDWALRRGDLPLVCCDGFLVYHRAGTAIGSPTLSRIASPFSHYFKYRSRMLFLRRFRPLSLPIAYAYALAKALQITLKGYYAEAWALIRAINGMGPPKSVKAILKQSAPES